MVLLVLAAVCAIVYVLLRRRDRRMLRNGVLLLGVVVFAVLGVVDVVLQRFPAAQVLLVGAILLFPVGVVVLAGFLVANGVRMFRREGRSLGNLLSLIVGVLLIGVVALCLTLIRSGSTAAEAVLLLVLAVAGYVGVVFTVFLLYALVYGHIDKPRTADVVVILGSGLVRGSVPPLLRSRLDKGIEVWRYSVAQGRETILIPSGGQGADEPRPEGEAMAEYLIGQGVPETAVLPETRSRNTDENLRFSRTVQEEAGVSGEVVVATSDYHVLRAAMLARSVGSDAEVVGARTARYYVPSAFLREFVAVVAAHRTGHAVALAVVVALSGWLAVTAVL
ncbi:YdcF family protein [Curtobacterium sp. UNCCL17]|uniref:YdcF family protein n=1 Tax=Curtobacterium sp. UNCCL17 TaxID=1449051 RepID=UPI000482680B|nr:YdcF family protein [Curtobacterium sp. UNCCL17]